MNLKFREEDEGDELPIYEVRGNKCVAVLGKRILVKKIDFKKIKRFLSDK